MISKRMFSWIENLFSIPTDNPELLKAQCAALSRLVPLMYFILVANAWVLAATFIHQAPIWLTVYVSLVLTAICMVRLAVWWTRRHAVLTPKGAARELLRTNYVAALLAVAFPAWSFALFPYGDTLAKSHVALFMTISLLGTMYCLTHLRSAALIVALIGGGSFVGFFSLTGIETFRGMAVNVALVAIASAIVIGIQSRDFIRMVNTQIDARRKDLEQTRLLHMIDNMPVAVMTVEPDTLNISYVNETSKRLVRSIEHLLPVKAENLLGTSIDVFHRHPEHQRRILADQANLPYNARINLGPEVLDLKISAVRDDDDNYIAPMLTWALVTKEVEAENRIRQLAQYDVLTGLPNRNSFHEHLEATLCRPDNRSGLLFIDLDGFKIINDSSGHKAGDALLKQVAGRLRSVCSSPGMTIGRIGGDEFAILLPCGEPDRAIDLAGTIINAISAPYHLENSRNVQIGASIGIALAPLDGDNSETLLARADIALYAAKNGGKRTFRMFSPDMEVEIQERVRLEAKLRTAMENQDGLFVFYQPIVDVVSGQVTAREALMRWFHPLRGWVSPGEFIPVAEQSGLIDELGLFVLNRACQDAAGWEDGARVAVNVSAGQLGKGRLPPAVLTALVNSGLAPSRLEIEVTETALLANESDSIGELRRLRDMGVRVALDDFGTGFSSLSHLRLFQFDKIKIDGSFVRDAVNRPDCAAVVKAIADLGKRLGVTTVAEGVETQAHLDRVREEGCSEVQGYFYGRPAPSERDIPFVEELNRNGPASLRGVG